MPADPLAPAHVAHRTGFEQFVLAEAAPFFRLFLGRLYARWHQFNQRWYDGALTTPYLTFGTPRHPRALGTCARLTDWGERLQICLRTSLVDGSHPLLVPGDELLPGRLRVLDDILLHEMIHQWQFEILGDGEPGYKGHGPSFAAECNRIGAQLDLPPVRPAKQRGPHAMPPSCAQWPLNVRPTAYYEGALERPFVGEPVSRPLPTRSTSPLPAPQGGGPLKPRSGVRWSRRRTPMTAHGAREMRPSPSSSSHRRSGWDWRWCWQRLGEDARPQA